MDLQTITEKARAHGLEWRGGFAVRRQDKVPISSSGAAARSLVLLGNAGSSVMWPVFSNSIEYLDGKRNPLDRWSKRVGDTLAAEIGGTAYYPFGGPPYQPFINWAKKAESLRSSKLGMLLHPDYGLWHAYRMAIAMPDTLFSEPSDGAKQPHACDTCADQPCYGICPVDAFANEQYDSERCVRYLDANPDSDCNHHGCLARRNCPEGQQYQYLQPQAEFHMKQFVKIRMEALAGDHD